MNSSLIIGTIAILVIVISFVILISVILKDITEETKKQEIKKKEAKELRETKRMILDQMKADLDNSIKLGVPYKGLDPLIVGLLLSSNHDDVPSLGQLLYTGDKQIF